MSEIVGPITSYTQKTISKKEHANESDWQSIVKGRNHAKGATYLLIEVMKNDINICPLLHQSYSLD